MSERDWQEEERRAQEKFRRDLEAAKAREKHERESSVKKQK